MAKLERLHETIIILLSLYKKPLMIGKSKHLVLFLSLPYSKISSIMYFDLCRNGIDNFIQDGWNLLQKLNMAPNTKLFTWIILYGIVKTQDYFHALILSTVLLCAMWLGRGDCRTPFSHLSQSQNCLVFSQINGNSQF